MELWEEAHIEMHIARQFVFTVRQFVILTSSSSWAWNIQNRSHFGCESFMTLDFHDSLELNRDFGSLNNNELTGSTTFQYNRPLAATPVLHDAAQTPRISITIILDGDL